MSIRAASSYATQGAFVLAIGVAYTAVAAGVFGYLGFETASLISLAGCAIGSAAGLTNLLVERKSANP
jgi:hypothetical protein